MKLMSVDAALAAMLAEAPRLGVESVFLDQAIGRLLAEDVTAVRDQPPFDASAMDGWAVRSADAPGELSIAGESAAGHGYEGVLQPGQAVRIFTGGALPAEDEPEWAGHHVEEEAPEHEDDAHGRRER